MKGRIPGGFEGALFCILKNASQTYASLREWHRGVARKVSYQIGFAAI